jgi:hypothetical protein
MKAAMFTTRVGGVGELSGGSIYTDSLELLEHKGLNSDCFGFLLFKTTSSGLQQSLNWEICLCLIFSIFVAVIKYLGKTT